MKAIVAEGAGFCFGVKRALKLAFEAARQGHGTVVTLGAIIHNPQVVAPTGCREGSSPRPRRRA